MGHALTEDTIPMILRRTERKVKERAEDYSPRVTGVERTRKVWFFEVGDYVVRLRAIPKSGKQQRVEQMDVKVKCSCPSWRWNGPEHWAMEHEYQYGRPKGTASYPKVNDPKFRHAACKHVVAVFEHVKAKKMKIEAPKKLSEMIEQLSVVHGIADKPPLKKRVRRKKYGRLDRAFKDPHPGIQYKLQPPRGNSQHGPEQTIEGDETMTSMAALIERTEGALTEDLKLSKKDKQVIGAFLDKKAMDGTRVSTDGKSLDIDGMGGKGAAVWKGGKIHFQDLGSRSGQTLQRAVRKMAPKNYLSEEYGRATIPLDGGSAVGDTENNWVVVDVDSGGTIGQGFSSRQAAEGFCQVNNLGLIPEEESSRMEKADPIMLSLKRDHPNIVWTMPSNR